MDRVAFVNVFHGISRLPSRSSSPFIIQRLPSHLHSWPHHPSVSTSVPRRCRTSMAAADPPDNADVTKQQERKKDKQSAARVKDTSVYSSTVNLPQTNFEQRANALKKEPKLQAFWEENRVYERLSRENSGDPFILHDGPPFANGPIHCGHALNKILKDFINKHALMNNRRSIFIPGWDTHGLPIELKVLQSLKSKDKKGLTTVKLREKARNFALETVANHIVGMRRFGCWGEWTEPYLTLNPTYEAAQIRVFAAMFDKGYVFRGKKPVHWSPSSRTALAEAELEYPDNHTSKSCYCAFRVTAVPDTCPSDSLRQLCNDPSHDVNLSIWTTTPWTLPANRAVAVNKNLDYTVVKGLHPTRDSALIVVATDLVPSVCAKLGLESDAAVQRVATVKGSDLVGIQYTHPLQDGLTCRVVEGGDYITTETGTGLVHTAPGHGQEDYQTGLREGLELASPVDDAGKFTEEAGNGEFVGLSVLSDGTDAVLARVESDGTLLLQEMYKHKYPYDWRSKKPTIFRATEQWFISIDDFRQQVLDEIERVEWFPKTGINRIRGMVEGRGDWCISRQRSWGVPIPVFYDTDNQPVMSADIVEHICALIEKEGSDVWWKLESDDLLPEAHKGKGLRKGNDTMDVWFDSGTSWAGVIKQHGNLELPADIYLEGSDQHRGWFQSSLLTSVATENRAPYKKVLTHGFVLDEKGVKMSKSIGNVIDPLEIINGGNNKKVNPAYGADVLRLWVCSIDYSVDSMIGPSIMRQVSDVYKKVRNTLRYMIGNVNDYDPNTASHQFSYSDLPSLDKYMLARMAKLCDEIDNSYATFSYFKLYQTIQKFVVVEMSNFYLDIAKDRLYIPAPDSYRRRTCQQVLVNILENFTKAMAPILPHTAEDLWQNLPYKDDADAKTSIFEAGWMDVDDEWRRADDDEVMQTWAVVLDVRDSVNKVLQEARVAKTLGAPMEASVKIFARNDTDREALRALQRSANKVDDLYRALIVSEAVVVDTEDDIMSCAHHNGDDKVASERFLVGMNKCTTTKCDRCWHFDETVGTRSDHPLVCNRCAEALTSMGVTAPPSNDQVAAAATV